MSGNCWGRGMNPLQQMGRTGSEPTNTVGLEQAVRADSEHGDWGLDHG